MIEVADAAGSTAGVTAPAGAAAGVLGRDPSIGAAAAVVDRGRVAGGATGSAVAVGVGRGVNNAITSGSEKTSRVGVPGPFQVASTITTARSAGALVSFQAIVVSEDDAAGDAVRVPDTEFGIP